MSGGTIRGHDLTEAGNIDQLKSCAINSVRVRAGHSFTR